MQLAIIGTVFGYYTAQMQGAIIFWKLLKLTVSRPWTTEDEVWCERDNPWPALSCTLARCKQQALGH